MKAHGSVLSIRQERCAYLYLTESCNLRCLHCFVNAAPGHGMSMDPQTVGRAIDLMEELGVSDVRLTGGEPTIHRLFPTIVEQLNDHGMSVRLITNGVSVRHNPTRYLRGVSSVWVSCYGTTEHEHRSIAGSQALSLTDTIELVGELSTTGCAAGLSVLIQPGSIRSLKAFLATIVSSGVAHVRLLPVQPDGRAVREVGADWSKHRSELAEVREIARELLIDSRFSRLVRLTVNDIFAFENQPGVAGCLLKTRTMFAITADGSVYPCCFTAYEDRARICSVHDSDATEQLSQWSVDQAPTGFCRAIHHSFWKVTESEQVGCPIAATTLLRRTR